MRNRLAILGLAALVGPGLVPETCGDILRFKEGGQVVAPSTREGREIILDTPMGTTRFPEGDFREIIETPDPRDEWAGHLARAKKDGAAGLCAASLWALDHGLVKESEAAAREAHRFDAKHEPASRMVRAMDRLAESRPDPSMASILKGLPADHRIARGPHVVLIHQHSDDEAAERVALLETIVGAYTLHISALGLALPAPSQKLPSMWFAKKADYLAFLRSEGATAFLNTRGYHHPTREMVVTYDSRDDPERKRGTAEVLSARSELSAFAEKADTIPASGRARVMLRGKTYNVDRNGARKLIDGLGREVDRQEIVHELGRREIDWGVAAHETIHQLVAATKLAPRHDSFPPALSEGLAMQFEAVTGGRWAGLSGVPTYRLRDYRALKTPPGLIATLGDPRFGPGYNPDEYARAWAAVRFLRVENPSAFIAMIDGLRAPTTQPEPASSRASKTLAGLLKADIDAEWHRAVEGLRLNSEPPNPSAHPH